MPCNSLQSSRIAGLVRVSALVLVAFAMMAGTAPGLRGQTATAEERLPESVQVGPPAPETSANAPTVPAGAGLAFSDASLEMLQKSDAAASQRLRFDAGDRVFFSAGSAELGSRASVVLSRQARWLSAWNASVIIAGHADEGGSAENDERVALQRAETVRDRLREEGITPDRLRVLGLGRRDPIATCPEQECAVQNRRAVIHVMSVKTDGAQP
ncbi:MAG: OmpA family protein [Alphaproteobacteria bacterium]|nr:OmpA family protein [Alphaproteobacteria bacterium]